MFNFAKEKHSERNCLLGTTEKWLLQNLNSDKCDQRNLMAILSWKQFQRASPSQKTKTQNANLNTYLKRTGNNLLSSTL